MFVLSLKISRAKIIGVICLFIVFAAIIAFGIDQKNEAQSVISTNVKGNTNEDRLTFIKSKGWTVSSENPESVDIIIPSEFDNIYEKYNSIQKAQGYDLTKYKCKKVSRYTYVISNYPIKQDSPVNINIIVYDEVVIGGDICSTALGGFIHGFDVPSK